MNIKGLIFKKRHSLKAAADFLAEKKNIHYL